MIVLIIIYFVLFVVVNLIIVVSVDYGRFYPGGAYYYDEARDNVSLTILYQF